MPLPHAPSLYAATAGELPAFPSLSEGVRAHVAVVGGGYTGLSAALHLAEAGIDVVLVEAERVGWGASGRNGGQLHSGQRCDQDWIEARLGSDMAHALWRLGEEAKALVKDLIARHAIDCGWRGGLIEAVHKQRLVANEIAYVEKLRRDYGYDQVEWLDRDAVQAAIGTDVYFGGRRDTGGGHLDPLRFAAGLARAAAKAGARIFEGTRVTGLSGSATTGFRLACSTNGNATAEIRADSVVLAGNGYLDGIDGDLDAHVMPIDNYILATAPIGAGMAGGVIPGGEAVSDTRFVVYYFRPSPEGRLIFGGGETYSLHEPRNLSAFIARQLARIYPQLAGIKVDYAWGGRLGITLNRMPFVRRLRAGVYTAAGYSGQGVALAPFAGKILADAIAGNTSRFDRFAAIPSPPFPGGRLLRYPALLAGMSWYALRDRL